MSEKKYDKDRAIWEILWFLKRASDPDECWDSIPLHELIIQLRSTMDKTVCEGALAMIWNEYGMMSFGAELD